jgi:FkbM family methyltransferase
MFKRVIDKILREKGYEINRIQTIDVKIESGEFKWLQEFGIKTVLDVGANVGLFTEMVSKILPQASIYAFEPLTECYEKLNKLTDQIKKLKCFNVALGSENMEAVINKNMFTASSSLLKMRSLHKETFPYTAIESEEKIQVVTFESLINEIQLEEKVLLKLDVQGYEIEVLRGMKSVLNNIDLIIAETSFVELYQGQPLFNEVYDFLRNKGFEYYGNFDQMTDPKAGSVLQADAIFAKKDIKL